MCRDVMLGQPHPNCRCHRNWLLLRGNLGSAAAHFAAEEGINAGRKMRAVLPS
jgi:hypothetical protein